MDRAVIAPVGSYTCTELLDNRWPQKDAVWFSTTPSPNRKPSGPVDDPGHEQRRKSPTFRSLLKVTESALAIAGSLIGVAADIGGAIGLISSLFSDETALDNGIADIANALSDIDQKLAMNELERHWHTLDTDLHEADNAWDNRDDYLDAHTHLPLPGVSMDARRHWLQALASGVTFLADDANTDEWGIARDVVPLVLPADIHASVPPASGLANQLDLYYPLTLPRFLAQIARYIAASAALGGVAATSRARTRCSPPTPSDG